MYLEYFNLNETPFSLTPDPRYLFMSSRHREGLAHLLYGVKQSGGFVQLTGEVGSGKTTLSRCLINQLPQNADVALILNPRLNVVELLATICDELKIPHASDIKSIKVLIDVLNAYLLDAHARRRRTILIIDEAQNLNIAVLEQVRLLTNLETEQEKLLQIILLGQPELLTLLQSERLRQLSQRITARYHLEPLSRDETCAYVRHRLAVAGRKEPLFTQSALNCVYRLSGGIPRLVNVICDRALLGAYAQDKRKIDAAIVRQAGRETSAGNRAFLRFRPSLIIGMAVLILAVLVGVIFVNPGVRSMFQRGDSSPTAAIHETAALDEGSHLGQHTTDVLPTVQIETTKAVVNQQSLVDVLSRMSGGDTSAFVAVYSLWGFDVPENVSGLGCNLGRDQGFECLFSSGGWPRLRRYDIPAILECSLPDGSRRQVALAGLGSETVQLVIWGEPMEFPITEIDRIWDGSFILLWKPSAGARPVAPRAYGEAVRWVRQALDRIEGVPFDSDASDIFDGELEKRVMAFQRQALLVPDGIVGRETLVRLTQHELKAPSLSSWE